MSCNHLKSHWDPIILFRIFSLYMYLTCSTWLCTFEGCDDCKAVCRCMKYSKWISECNVWGYQMTNATTTSKSPLCCMAVIRGASSAAALWVMSPQEVYRWWYHVGEIILHVSSFIRFYWNRESIPDSLMRQNKEEFERESRKTQEKSTTHWGYERENCRQVKQRCQYLDIARTSPQTCTDLGRTGKFVIGMLPWGLFFFLTRLSRILQKP